MAETVRRRVQVQGKVQGVFFRDSTRQCANEIGVSGWVRNCPDGTVEAVFEGPSEAVDRAVDFCRNGPSSAHVHNVDVTEEQPEGLTGFKVR